MIFRNKYSVGGPISGDHSSASAAQEAICTSPYYRWLFVKQIHFGCHWHRPPVGMRADQASHEWQRVSVNFLGDGHRWQLVPR